MFSEELEEEFNCEKCSEKLKRVRNCPPYSGSKFSKTIGTPKNGVVIDRCPFAYFLDASIRRAFRLYNHYKDGHLLYGEKLSDWSFRDIRIIELIKSFMAEAEQERWRKIQNSR